MRSNILFHWHASNLVNIHSYMYMCHALWCFNNKFSNNLYNHCNRKFEGREGRREGKGVDFRKFVIGMELWRNGRSNQEREDKINKGKQQQHMQGLWKHKGRKEEFSTCQVTRILWDVFTTALTPLAVVTKW